nr:hypothetical protein BaRGS_012826 [Batillaria attramentaria]
MLAASACCSDAVEKDVKTDPRPTNFPFFNVSLSWEERVFDLVSRLTLAEAVLQMSRGGAREIGGPAPAISRLNIGPYHSDLMYRVAEATGVEVRAKHNQFVQQGVFTDHTGASCFSPVINIMRDGSVNGVPACANKHLLTDILREDWGFSGYVVSDQSAIELIQRGHHYLNDSIDIATACVNAGCNLELSGDNPDPVFFSIAPAVQLGLITMDTVMERVKPLFYTRMRLGEFDPPEMNPYSKLGSQDVQSQQTRQLSLEAAMKTFVLLKNRNYSFLPLSAGSYNKIGVVGPLANDSKQMYGDYAANPSPEYVVTPLQGLQKIFQNVNRLLGWQFYAVSNNTRLRPLEDFSMSGRTYRYHDRSHGDPLYPFGYGLSYTTFTFSDLDIPSVIKAGQALNGSVRIDNTGKVDGDEVLEVYISWDNTSLPAPRLQLVWFDRVAIQTGSFVQLKFQVSAHSMALWMNGGWVIPPGNMTLYAGGQQPSQARQAPSNVVSANFTIVPADLPNL